MLAWVSSSTVIRNAQMKRVTSSGGMNVFGNDGDRQSGD